VVIVEPGIVKTAILAKNTDAPNASGAYDQAYERLFAFYGKGLEAPGHPSEVAEVIHEAVTTDDYRLRWTCGWGGTELSNHTVTDEEWVALGEAAGLDEYTARFTELFGLDLS